MWNFLFIARLKSQLGSALIPLGACEHKAISWAHWACAPWDMPRYPAATQFSNKRTSTHGILRRISQLLEDFQINPPVFPSGNSFSSALYIRNQNISRNE
jgi:hypothetical protein